MKIDKTKLKRVDRKRNDISEAEWLEVFRLLEQGYTQASVAAQLGVNHSNISHLYRGYRIGKNHK